MNIMRKLKDLFADISQSRINDGLIDLQEFELALGLPNTVISARMFAVLNVTRTKTMNFREFVLAAALLSGQAPKEEKIRFSFDLYDLNGDRRIDRAELKTVLREALHEALRGAQSTAVRLNESQIEQVICNTFHQCAAARASLPASENMPMLPSHSSSSPQKSSRSGSGKAGGASEPYNSISAVANDDAIDYDGYRALILSAPRLLAPFTLDLDALFAAHDARALAMDSEAVRRKRPLVATRPGRSPALAPLSPMSPLPLLSPSPLSFPPPAEPSKMPTARPTGNSAPLKITVTAAAEEHSARNSKSPVPQRGGSTNSCSGLTVSIPSPSLSSASQLSLSDISGIADEPLQLSPQDLALSHNDEFIAPNPKLARAYSATAAAASAQSAASAAFAGSLEEGQSARAAAAELHRDSVVRPSVVEATFDHAVAEPLHAPPAAVIADNVDSSSAARPPALVIP